MASLIEGPVLPLLKRIGLDGPFLVLATAFYSRRPLEWLAEELTSPDVTFIGRLNLNNPEEWIRGAVDPVALLEFARKIERRGGKITLLVSSDAHAKVYLGNRGVIIGSANLSMNGFGGGLEIVTILPKSRVIPSRRAISRYSHGCTPLKLTDLEKYIKKYKARVNRLKRTSPVQDRLPGRRPSRKKGLIGTYNDFLVWAKRRSSPAAKEIVERAAGKGQLSGHIRQNFYGVRQFLLTDPSLIDRFSMEHPGLYKLSKDGATESRIAKFVRRNANSEGEFDLETWKTYLPKECGGWAGKHGGTIGNLNRMLPLEAKYLKEIIGEKYFR